ncbi:MAG: hypothetical protein A4S09_03945 [Proteobacteria bacterium SG_bin7]|nr:MAG: hypothetical protein A4S09_03945 [Proteobacteria bacterium SG_bin7]
MTSKVITPEVLIVGAGIAGTPLALNLHKKGIDVLLVDRTMTCRRVFKAEYMQPGPLNFLRKNGFSSIFKSPHFSSIHNLHFRDLGENNQDVIGEISMHYPHGQHAVTFAHDVLVESLRHVARKELKNRLVLGVNLHPTNISDPSFHERPEFEFALPNMGSVKIRPRWVVGADGRHSTVREWMKGPKAPKNLRVIWGAKSELIIGAEIAAPPPTKHTYQVVRSFNNGTLFAFNLPGVGQRLYFSAPEGTVKKDWQNAIQRILKDFRKFHDIGPLDTHAPIVGCPAFQTWLGPATRGRFVLCGDAVGVTTPYGGQGISVALEHVSHLIQNFEWRAQSQLISGLTRREYALMAESTHSRLDIINWSLYFLFFARNPISKLITQHVLNSWQQNPSLPAHVMSLFGGLTKEHPSISEVFDIWGLQKGRRAKLLSLLGPAMKRQISRIESNI